MNSTLLLKLLMLLSSIYINFSFSSNTKVRHVQQPRQVMMMAIPELSEWEILSSGEVIGIVRKHPSLDDGDTITTSPLKNPEHGGRGKIVTTKSGSKYKLVGTGVNNKKVNDSPPETERVLRKEKQEIRSKKKYMGLDLSSKTLDDGKYLLAGKTFRSTSGRSQIYFGFRTDKDGFPTGDRLAIKISPNYEALERESKNYNRVSFGIFSGQFVSNVDFLRVADEKNFGSQSALIVDGGVMNLEQYLNQRSKTGFEGRIMRDLAAAAGQCVQASHSSNMVWTDLKIDNFVVMDTQQDKKIKIKGIDLESAVPFGKNPFDYSPEACPPEFAKAFVSGDGADFICRPSYDIWSLGMMLYHLHTGSSYFTSKSPATITKLLSADQFSVNLSRVKDDKLRDLLKQCLDTIPNRRPDITRFLLHPFFTTTGIGPWSF